MSDDLVKRLRFYITGESPGSWRIATLNEAADRIEALEAANAWLPIETAPKDGTPILACRDNDCFYEQYVVWWSAGSDYPWQGDNNAYPEGRMDYWRPLPPVPVADRQP